MKLYAVKCGGDYLRKRDEGVALVAMNKASVFISLEEAFALRDAYGSGIIMELILSEKQLDL